MYIVCISYIYMNICIIYIFTCVYSLAYLFSIMYIEYMHISYENSLCVYTCVTTYVCICRYYVQTSTH